LGGQWLPGIALRSAVRWTRGSGAAPAEKGRGYDAIVDCECHSKAVAGVARPGGQLSAERFAPLEACRRRFHRLDVTREVSS
jgi:hypothetical protein